MSQRSQVARIGEYLLRQAALILAMLSVCMPLCAVEAVPSNEELERSHALIGKVVIDNENIFDLTDPRENNWLFSFLLDRSSCEFTMSTSRLGLARCRVASRTGGSLVRP